eukprot:TRINITY_DN43285_c0_g1_i1.p1 TRINITY_DN43285_c0_g1~~TRINITY_DN43285_c0_g1_i1.p1  ORF type:complete len:318 (-),score=38.35 TRINITY_DN43285_c0_g1_i1:123-1076(-)
MGCGCSSKQVVPSPLPILPVPEADGKDDEEDVVIDVTKSADIASYSSDIRDKFRFGEVLGVGTYGRIHLVHWKEDSIGQDAMALKVIERKASHDSSLIPEIEIMKLMSHTNIIRLLDSFEDGQFLYIVMDLCRGGTLFQKLRAERKLAERDCAHVARQTLSAIKYMHRLRVVHRDVKAENIMLLGSTIGSQIKLIDFGLSCRLEEAQSLSVVCGSPEYMAPEILYQHYSQEVDVWSCGVMVYLVLYGHYPHSGKDTHTIMNNIISEPIRWQGGRTVSRACLSFAKRLLELSPRHRIAASGALIDPWIVQEFLRCHPT